MIPPPGIRNTRCYETHFAADSCSQNAHRNSRTKAKTGHHRVANAMKRKDRPSFAVVDIGMAQEPLSQAYLPTLRFLCRRLELRLAMRLLLVEDEEKLARLVKRALLAERFSVDVARTGRAGMDLANTYDYDLLILDLQLPEMSGTEILRRVRRTNPNVPVLILTARDAVADKVAHFEAGADDYLTKPFAMAELLVRTKSLLRRGTSRRESVLRVANLELDRLTQQVRRAGKTIDLTAKEYALLEYLMANSDRVLSRSMILSHVWDDGFSGATNIVDVYVRHLRNKIEDDDQRLIRTMRGVGYAIREEGTS